MTLREEIAQGENVALEFKEARPKDSLKYLKAVVAFANGRGGRILLGVEDGTGRLVGIPREKVAKEMDALTDAIANSCTPPVSVEVRPTVLDGKSLIAVDVKGGTRHRITCGRSAFARGRLCVLAQLPAWRRNIASRGLSSLAKT